MQQAKSPKEISISLKVGQIGWITSDKDRAIWAQGYLKRQGYEVSCKIEDGLYIITGK
jgi:hypothetical protein